MTENSGFQPAETFPIDDVETLRLIVDETRVEIIELLGKPHSVAEIAERMGVPRTRLYHHFKLLEDAGVIVVVAERPAGAMTEKIYQVAAKTFQPSAEFQESATPRDLAGALIDSLFSITRTDFVRAVAEQDIELQDAADRRTLSLSRRLITLSPERAHELVERLEALILEFDDDPDEAARAYGILTIIHPSSRDTT
jgi:DNA-binding transcriptional ArsR family regulator